MDKGSSYKICQDFPQLGAPCTGCGNILQAYRSSRSASKVIFAEFDRIKNGGYDLLGLSPLIKKHFKNNIAWDSLISTCFVWNLSVIAICLIRAKLRMALMLAAVTIMVPIFLMVRARQREKEFLGDKFAEGMLFFTKRHDGLFILAVLIQLVSVAALLEVLIILGT